MFWTLKQFARRIRLWVSPIVDPVYALRGLAAYPRYWADWWCYQDMPGAEPLHWADVYPRLHDRTGTTPIDTHYFYVNGWAMRRINAQQPAQHLDIGSQIIFVNLLSAIVPVIFVDYRPLQVKLKGLTCLAASILQLPFADKTFESLSCLHVAEHIGLGRYGDPLDPQGTGKAAKELTRVLRRGGSLYFAVPVGRPRLCFNAHRVHTVEMICKYFSRLDLVELSGVHDDGRFVEKVGLSEFAGSDYACGFFWFRRP